MKIALVQTDSGRDREKNIEILAALGEKAKEADVVITPESSNLMGYWPSEDELFDTMDEPVVKMGQAWAKDHKCALILGSVLVKDSKRGGAVNRQLMIDPKGEIVAQYDKINMFDVDLANGERFRESDKFVAGEKAVVTEYDGVKFGHSICFDLRFPNLYRALAQNGAEVIVVPSAFTRMTGRAHWSTLLRARAIETGAFVLAPGQCGEYVHYDGSVRGNWGHSMAVSPWGEVMVEMDHNAGVAIVDVNVEKVRSARQQIPAWKANHEFEMNADGLA